MLPTTERHLPERDCDKALESTLLVKNVDYEALKQLNLHREKTFQDAHGGHRGSFEHVPFEGSTFNFDSKYDIQGRFAFDVDELPIHPKGGDRASHRENNLSKLSVCLEKSAMEDRVEIGHLLLSSPRG